MGPGSLVHASRGGVRVVVRRHAADHAKTGQARVSGASGPDSVSGHGFEGPLEPAAFEPVGPGILR
jgi:hypothetical protein